MFENWFKKGFLAVSLMIVLMIAFVPAAHAYTGRYAPDVHVPADEVIDDNLYAAGERIVIDGTITGDLVAFGSDIVVNGTVEGNIIGAGRTITVNGHTVEPLYLGGAAITFGPQAKTENDVTAAGYSLEVKQGASLGKDLLYAGYQGLMAGDVTRDAYIAAPRFSLQGNVAGNMVAEVAPKDEPTFDMKNFMQNMPEVPYVDGGLTFAENAKIGGALTYTSSKSMEIPSGVVAGDVTHLMPKTDTDVQVKPVIVTPQSMAVGWMLDNMRFLVSILIVGLLAIWLIPRWVTEPVAAMEQNPMPSLGWGVLSYILFWVLVAAAFVFVLFVTVFLGVLTLGGLAASVVVMGLSVIASAVVIFLLIVSFFTQVIVSYWAGQKILAQIKPDLADHKYWVLCIGIVVLVILAAIPILGMVIKLAAAFFGLGALFILARAWWRSRRAAQLPVPV